jgi:hypothetical protein
LEYSARDSLGAAAWTFVSATSNMAGPRYFGKPLQNSIFARRPSPPCRSRSARGGDDQRGFSIPQSVFNFANALHILATGRVIADACRGGEAGKVGLAIRAQFVFGGSSSFRWKKYAVAAVA